MSSRPSPLEQNPDQPGLFEVEVSRLAPARILDIPQADNLNSVVQNTPEPDGVADIREAAPFVLKALGHLAQANMREGFAKVAYTDEGIAVRHRYQQKGKDFAGDQEGARFTQKQEMRRAKEAMLHAYNLGLEEPAKIDNEDFTSTFNSFAQRYGVGGNPEHTVWKRTNRERAIKGLKELTTRVADLPEAKATTETFALSKEAGQRIKHKESQVTKNLELLHEHPNAGFWPASYQEGTDARKILRLTDEHPGALQNYLTDLGRSAGTEVVAAKIYEYADFMKSGMDSWQLLADLDNKITTFTGSPNTHLATIAGGARPVLAVLARFLDIESRATNPTHGQQFDPQRNRRTDLMDLGFGRHKQLHGLYESDAPEDLELVDSRIAALLGTMNLVQARPVIERALANEEARVNFWITTLQSLKGQPGRIARGELENNGVTVQ